MANYEIVSYDVWGNAVDGFEVNAAYLTGLEVDLNDEATDKEIIGSLRRAGFIGAGVHSTKFAVEGDDHCLYVTDNRTPRLNRDTTWGYGRPVCELRKK